MLHLRRPTLPAPSPVAPSPVAPTSPSAAALGAAGGTSNLRGRALAPLVAALSVAVAVVLTACLPTTPPPPATTTTTAPGPASFTFTGSGWGHGVGMSQWGARGMAANGATASQILARYYQGTAVAVRAEPAGPTVVTAAPAPLASVRANSSTVVTTGAGAVVGTVPAGATVAVARSGSQLQLTGALVATVPSFSAELGGEGVTVAPAGHRYGAGRLVVAPSGATDVSVKVAGLTVAQVLEGFGEMPLSWPTEALRAQVVAGRTFVVKRALAGGELRGWMDVAYIGSDLSKASTYPRWRAAVADTTGQVVVYNGALVDALYSASSGGSTEDSESVFVTALPYLRATSDPEDLVGGNPNASWQRVVDAGVLGRAVGCGGVATSVQVGAAGRGGRTDKTPVSVRCASGATVGLGGRSLMTKLNAAGADIRSTKFVVK